MHLTVWEQGELFRYAFLFGVLLGVLYDVFRLMRAAGFDSRRAVFLQDTAFMSMCAVLSFLFAQTTVHGHFRAYLILGHLSGLLAYRLSVGMVTGFFIKISGRLFVWISGSFDKGVIFTAELLKKCSINLSRVLRRIRRIKPVIDTKEKIFHQI